MHVALSKVTIEKLQAFGRRRRMLIGVRGFCAGIVALLGVMSIVALADRFIVLGDMTRLILSVAGYLIVIGVAWLTCIRMIMRIPSEKELARLVETASPGLREDLVSAVELGSPNSDARYDSEVFRNLLQRDVASKMQAVKIERILPPGLVAKWVQFACLVLMLCVGLMLIPGLRFGDLLTRALMPLANVDRVSNVHVRLVAPNPADPLVPHNEAVNVIVEHIDGAMPDRIILESFRKEAGRENEQLVMKPTGTANQYAATLQIGREAVEYRILAGDAVTKKYRISTAARPHVTAFEKTFHYPKYTRRTAETIADTNGDIRALEGTNVDLVLKTDQAVESGELRIESAGKQQLIVPLTVVDDKEVRAAVPVDATATYKIHLVARDTQFSNPFDPQYEIVADPDKPPTVELRQPLQNLLMPGDEIVRTLADATDDLGLNTVAQMIRVNDGRWIEVIVGENVGKEFRVQRNLDLFDLAVKPGDRVQTRFAATDFAGNKGESTIATVTVSSSGFDPSRFSAIKAKQAAYQALAELRTVTADYSLAVRQAGQRVKGGVLERQQALQNMSDAATQIQASATVANEKIQAALRLNTSGSDADDLVLVGRLVSRVRDEWATTIAGAAIRASGLASGQASGPNDLATIGAEAELSQQAVRAAEQALDQSVVGFRKLLAADEAGMILRDLISLGRDQSRIDPNRWPDEPATWQRLARRQSAIATQLRLVDEIATQLKTRGNAAPFEAINNAMATWQKPRASVENRLAAGPVDASFGDSIDQMTTGIATASNMVGPAAKQLAGTAADEGRQLIEQAVGSQWQAIDATHKTAGEAYNAKQILLDQRARGAGEFAVVQADAQSSAAQSRNKTTWSSAIDLFKQTSALNQSRSDGNTQFIADLGLTKRALQSLRVKFDSDQAREAVASLRIVASAFQTLEAGRGVADLIATGKSLSAREKWLRSEIDAVTQHPRDWDWFTSRTKTSADELQQAGLPAAAAAMLRQISAGDAVAAIGSEMSRRRAMVGKSQKQNDDLDNVVKQLAAVQQLIEEDMAHARKLIADQSPKISEMMAKLANDAAQLGDDAARAKENAADDAQPDDEAKQQIEDLAEKQDELNEQLADLADALREEANVQDAFSKEGRELARDADDAAAMIQQPAKEAQAAAKEANALAQDDRKPADALEQVADQDKQLAKNLKQLAEHFENVEQGKGELTRAALRDAERDLGIQRDLDKEFGRMEKLSEIAKLDPEQQLKELEKELDKNPAMKRELSDIARDAIADARDELNEAAAQERRIANDLDDGKADNQKLNPKIRERLDDLAQRAKQMAKNEVAQVAEHALQGAQNAQKPLNKAMQALEKAGQSQDGAAQSKAPSKAELAKQANELQDALSQAADNLDEANKQASRDVEGIRKKERDATAKLALGNNTPEQRLEAAETIQKAPKQQEAARATRDASELISKDARKLADEAKSLARELQRAADQDADAVKQAAKQQQPIGEAVDKAKENVARAARHEERLGNEPAAKQLDQADKGIAKADQDVAKAQEQLALANSKDRKNNKDNKGNKDGQDRQDRQDMKKAAQQAVKNAEKSLEEQRENLDDILGQPQPRYSDENGNPLPEPSQGNPTPEDAQDAQSKNSGQEKSDPKSQNSKSENPKSGQPKNGQPKSGDPKSGDSKSGDPKSGDPKSGEPKESPSNGSQPLAKNGQSPLDKAMKNAADALDAGKQTPQDKNAAKWMARALDELDKASQSGKGNPSKAMADGQPKNDGQPKPGQSDGQKGEGQSQPQKGQSAQGESGQGKSGQGMAQAADAVKQAAQAQAQAMAQARQAGKTPGQANQPGPGQPGQPGQGQPGQQGQPVPGGTPQPGQAMAQGQGQQPGQQPGQEPSGQGNQSGKGAAVAANGEAVGLLPNRVIVQSGDWGKLPPKLAEDLLEGQRNGVAPEYRDLVEAYFRAIAKKARDSSPSNN